MFLEASVMDMIFFFFFEIKELCKLSCIKIFLLSIVAQKGNTLIFYIFEYGAECSAESGAK